MSADRLREAAALLRERAEETHDGPWDHVVGASGDTAWVERRNIETVVETHDIGTSAYIATMHPPVALALADWLDTAGADEWAHGPHCLTPCDDCDDDPRASHIRSALAVADAILGGER